MNKYEAVILYSQDLSVSNLKKLNDIVENHISELGGSLIANEDWGLRNLSYNILKNKKAFYMLYQIEIVGDKIQEIKKILSQNEQIIRHLFIKVENHSELPTILQKSEN